MAAKVDRQERGAVTAEQYDLARRISWGIIRRRFHWMPRDDKDDLLQAGVIRVWKSGATEPAHVHSAARTGIIDEFRRLYGRRPHTQQARFNQASWDDIEADHYIGRPDDTSLDLESVLSVLPERERFIVGRRMQGYGMREIGDELGVSECRVSQLCMDVRHRIKHSRVLEAA